jgi:hypothetical protein
MNEDQVWEPECIDEMEEHAIDSSCWLMMRVLTPAHGEDRRESVCIRR